MTRDDIDLLRDARPLEKQVRCGFPGHCLHCLHASDGCEKRTAERFLPLRCMQESPVVATVDGEGGAAPLDGVWDLEPLLASSEPQRAPLRCAVLLSGGVDSSVSLALAKVRWDRSGAARAACRGPYADGSP